MRVLTLPYIVAATATVHREPTLPSSWQVIKDTSANTDVDVAFSLSVKQPEQGLERIRQHALRASTPKDPLYGQFLATAEIAALCKPADADLGAVRDWATSGGCKVTFVQEMVSNK